MIRALATLAFSLLVGLVATGCGSAVEKKDDPKPEPITRAADPPRSDTNSPPLGKARAKLSPSAEGHVHDMRASDSLYRDETPH